MFIAFEGTDGVGKTTQLKLLYEYLIKSTDKKIVKFSLGSFPVLKKYIEQIKHYKGYCTPEIRELLYYFEGNLLSEWYAKNQKDYIVLCDRWILTFFSYGVFNGVDKEDIEYLTANLIRPDIYFFFRLDIDEAYERIVKYRAIDHAETGYKVERKISKEEMKIQFLSTQKKILDNFYKFMKSYDFSLTIIDASQSIEEINRQIVFETIKHMKNN